MTLMLDSRSRISDDTVLWCEASDAELNGTILCAPIEVGDVPTISISACVSKLDNGDAAMTATRICSEISDTTEEDADHENWLMPLSDGSESW